MTGFEIRGTRGPGVGGRGTRGNRQFRQGPPPAAGGGSNRKGCRFLAIAILASPALAVAVSIGTYLAWPS